MTNTEFKAINIEELAMILGGKSNGPESADGPIDFLIKAYSDERVQAGCKKIGVKIIMEAGQTANNIVNSVMDKFRSIKNWF